VPARPFGRGGFLTPGEPDDLDNGHDVDAGRDVGSGRDVNSGRDGGSGRGLDESGEAGQPEAGRSGEGSAEVRRIGLAGSHAQARQLVLHGHVTVNGRKVNIPSFLVSVGDEVILKPKMHENTMVLEARNVAQSQNMVPWLDIDRDNFKARVVAMPKRENVQTPVFNEQLIVELYSK